jgi:two-component system, LytTR family, response regulator AlgR
MLCGALLLACGGFDVTQLRTPMRAMVVDDEPLARQRLISLLGRLEEPLAVVAECGDAGSAMAWLEAHPGQAQVAFLDIQMPGPDGLRLADKLRTLPQAPLVVFVTAHAEHALRAFELEAGDYLTKPVRLDRLAQAVVRCRKMLPEPSRHDTSVQALGDQALVVQDRGRVVRVPLAEVLYLKAELKYVTLRTAEHSYVLDESLTELESRLGAHFIRVHRNALVARTAMHRLERRDDEEGHEGWAAQVKVTGEWLQVSRRQVPAVRETLVS